MKRQLRISGSDDIEILGVDLERNTKGEIELRIHKPGYYGITVYKLYVEDNGTISGEAINLSKDLSHWNLTRGVLNLNHLNRMDR